MKVHVNLNRCVGQGMCILYAPGAFELSDEDGRAFAVSTLVPKDQADAVRQAASACPEQAIEISED